MKQLCLWVLFDVSNEDCIWYFTTREEARKYRVRQNSNPNCAVLIGPYRFIPFTMGMGIPKSRAWVTFWNHRHCRGTCVPYTRWHLSKEESRLGRDCWREETIRDLREKYGSLSLPILVSFYGPIPKAVAWRA